MVVLTDEQSAALLAFCEAFDLHTTGAWTLVEAGMRDEFGIDDPEAALTDAKQALQGG